MTTSRPRWRAMVAAPRRRRAAAAPRARIAALVAATAALKRMPFTQAEVTAAP